MNFMLISRALPAVLAAFCVSLNLAAFAQESIPELTAAAKKNNPEAQYKLGVAYEIGRAHV
jgi:TPR repeat protein